MTARQGAMSSEAHVVLTSAAAWYLLVVVCLLYPLALDRREMIDNVNYVDYFINGRDLAWTWLFTEADSWLQLFFRLSTEEVLWLAWTSLAGWMFDPEAAVYVTVVLLNLLVVLALKDCPNRALALALWILIPVGFAVTGTYQIRQGAAFALWLYLGVRRERLVLASVLAALVHTTFSVIAVLSLIATFRCLNWKARVAAIVAVGLFMAVAGEVLFSAYGGRRLVEAAVLDPDTLSLNFLLGLLVVAGYPTYLLVSDGGSALVKAGRRSVVLQEYLLLYVGIVLFMIVSFFVFPIGNYRLPYIAWLGLIPIVGHFDFSRMRIDEGARNKAVIGFGLMFSFLLYQAIGAALNNRYACVLVPNCADVLGG